jgi:hypothetical protein
VVKEKSGHGIFFTTSLLIAVAEFGDKAQLAVVGLSSTTVPIAVWLGSTAALASISALGIVTGPRFFKENVFNFATQDQRNHLPDPVCFCAYRGYISYPRYINQRIYPD